MPLAAPILAQSLANDWLVPDGGSFPSAVAESGQKFASAVSNWFAAAMASGFPCATAAARMGQLATSAAGAFSANSASAAGAQLSVALMGYMTGQLFGPGVASPPTATAAAQSVFVAVFADLDAPHAARAQRIAGAVQLMAASTLVIFPPVIGPPSPVV